MGKTFSKLLSAVVIYAAFAIYLHQPYFKNFRPAQYLLLANLCVGSLGCFILSGRWVSSFTASFLAGAIYGFGPFVLGLAKFHPAAGLLAAAVPWLFCPAAFWAKDKRRWLSVPLSAVPFLAILLFFQLSAYERLFAIPTQLKLRLADLSSLLAPLVMANRSSTLFGFYHVPIAPLIMGFAMLLAAKRFGPLIILAIGTVLAFCPSLLEVSPIIWLTLPVLCCSVLVGAGTQGLIEAGFSDPKYILTITMSLLALSVITLLLATEYFQVFASLADKYAKFLTLTAKIYLLAAVATAIIFFIARAKLRVTVLRRIVLCSAMALDIFLGARFIVDKIF